MKVKRAKYIDKNNTLCQELYFAHPQSKFKVNNIYNSHFTGSQLWDLGGREMEKLESTYNRSVKIMFNLPWATHRKLIEPLTGAAHIRRTLGWRYLTFIRNIQKSEKKPLRNLLNLVKSDARTRTGSNLRRLMILSGKNTIEEVLDSNIDFVYHKLEEDQNWKVNMLAEIIDVLNGEKIIEDSETDDLTDILEYLFTG